MLGPLALALTLQVPPLGDLPDLVAAAVAADTIEALERRWLEELATDPGDERAALGLAFAATARYRHAEASDRFERVAADPDADPGAVALASYGRGQTAITASDYTLAADAFERATALAIERNDSALVTLSLTGRAVAAGRIESVAAAFELYEAAARWTRVGAPAYPPYLCNRAGVDRSVTIDAIERAAEAAADRNALQVQGRCLFQAVVRLALLGDTEAIGEAGARAVDRLTAARDEHGLASALQWLGFYAGSLGSFPLADSLLHRALRAGEASGNRSALAWSYVNLSGLSASQGRVDDGVAYVARARALLEEQGDRAGMVSVLGIEGALWMVARDYERAADAFEAAMAMATQIGQLQAILATHAAIGRVEVARGRFDAAERHFRAYHDLVEANDLHGWRESARLQLADLALERRDIATADSLLTFPDTARQATRYAQVLTKRAEVRAHLGDLDAALALATQAADMIDRWREQVSDELLRLYAFQHDEGDRGVATTVAALARAGRHADAFALGERRRARELLDQLTREAVVADRPVETRTALHVTLAELQALTDDSTAVLSYHTGEREPTTLIVVTRDGVTSHALPPVDSLRSDVERLARAAESGAHDAGAASRLSAVLLQGLSDLPGDVSRLVVIPEDVIHRVPFDLLHVGERTSVLDRFAISSVPSASVAVQLWRREGVGARGSILAIGDPTWPDSTTHPAFAGTGGLPRLPGSRREARAVARYARSAELRTGADATEAFLRSADLSDFDVVHLATHAVVDPRTSTRTAVALAPGDGEDGFMSPADLADLDLRARLVVVSACRSGGGEIVRGEGLQGLTAPLLRAGAHAVLATLWRVDDARVQGFVEDFYEALSDGLIATDALRRAKTEARDRGASPATWAAFTLVGDQGVSVALRSPRWWADARLAGALALIVGLLALARRGRTERSAYAERG